MSREVGRVRVKVCCIQSPDDARLAVDAGADAVGLVSAMPSGPGPIDDAIIAAIAAAVPPPVARFLLTSRTTARAVADQLAATGCDTVQLCAAMAPGQLAMLRAAVTPGVRIVQVIHVPDAAAETDAVAAEPHVDALLLDSGRPSAATPTLGGTGDVHDWSISARIVARAGVPVFLAGGLNAANVATAIAAVRPYGVDVCSSLRPGGVLDPDRLTAFMAAVAAARA